MSKKTWIYYPWMHKIDEDFASIGERPEEIRRKAYLLNEGVSCKEWFPEMLPFELENDSGIRLVDSIPNNVLFPIVSEKLKGILIENSSVDIEFLPIDILDHRKKSMSKTYCIANVLKAVDCMDKDKSNFVMGNLDKTQVHHIKRLYLDESKIPEDVNIFRLGEESNLLLVREDLANTIMDAGCTGIDFIDMKDYGKEYRPVDRLALAEEIFGSK